MGRSSSVRFRYPTRISVACLTAALIGAVGVPGYASEVKASKPVKTVKPVCTLTDDRLPELSGLASDGRRWYAVNDGGSAIEVFVLNRSCSVREVITADADPYDIEDLALTRDGTLWLADTGDNNRVRSTIALHRVKPDGGITLHRLTYPDGSHDAEALLMGPDGVPHVVTKNIVGQSGIYRPVSALRSPGPTRLELVGELSLTATSTRGGPIGGTGSVTITGGAISRDGAVVALRTYTDAYLYPAPDGDVVAALARKPVRVPLPNEQQGEAIAFEPDGTLLSAGEGIGQKVRALAGATRLVAPARMTEVSKPGGSTEGESAEGRALTPALAAAGLAAAALFVVLGWRRRRRR